MRPTQRLGQRTRITIHLKQRIVAAIGVGLQNAGEALEMALGVLLSPIARGIVERCRRRLPTERPVIPDIGPDASGVGLAFGEDRHGGVIAMQTLGGQYMRLDQPMQRLQRRGAGADLVGRGDGPKGFGRGRSPSS